MKLTNILLFIFIIMLSSCTVKMSEVSVSADYYVCDSRPTMEPQTCLAGLSSTMITCYYYDEDGSKRGFRCSEGWKGVTSVITPDDDIVPNQPISSDCKDYRCYPQKGYCRLEGLLTNPKVPIGELDC